MAFAVISLSPVNIATSKFIFLSNSTAGAAFSFAVSIAATAPAILPSTARSSRFFLPFPMLQSQLPSLLLEHSVLALVFGFPKALSCLLWCIGFLFRVELRNVVSTSSSVLVSSRVFFNIDSAKGCSELFSAEPANSSTSFWVNPL